MKPLHLLSLIAPLSLVLLLAGCSVSYVSIEASGSSKINADTSTSQDSSGEGAQGLLDKIIPGFSNPVDILTPLQPVAPVVPPAAPVVPVVPIAPVEDGGTGNVTEVD